MKKCVQVSRQPLYGHQFPTARSVLNQLDERSRSAAKDAEGSWDARR